MYVAARSAHTLPYGSVSILQYTFADKPARSSVAEDITSDQCNRSLHWVIELLTTIHLRESITYA